MSRPLSIPETREILIRFLESSDQPDFRHYGGGLLKDLRNQDDARFFWSAQYMMRLGHFYNADIIDIGCGFAWISLAITLLGNNRMLANDIRPYMTAIVQQGADKLRSEGVPLSFRTVTGDICTLDLPPQSVDGILCNEAIEHVRDLDIMFDQFARLLRPGGRFVITNDNNVWNSKKLAGIEKAWKERDRSWKHIEEIRERFPADNADAEPYAVMREKILRAANPRLDDSAIATLATATAGLTRKDIEPLARDYQPGKPLPTPPRFSWCRNPETGEYSERQLDPFEIQQQLAAHGLKASVYHGFRKFPLSLLNSVPFPPLNKALFGLREYFLIAGYKQK